jgi:hypothetical protein
MRNMNGGRRHLAARLPHKGSGGQSGTRGHGSPPASPRTVTPLPNGRGKARASESAP